MTTTNSALTRTYKGHSYRFREDGFFDMTGAAKHFEKDLSHFMRSPDTKAYLEELGNSAENAEYIQAKKGRNGGTWGHPELAVFFARWLDVKFARWCDAQIKDILKGYSVVQVVEPEKATAPSLEDKIDAVLALVQGKQASKGPQERPAGYERGRPYAERRLNKKDVMKGLVDELGKRATGFSIDMGHPVWVEKYGFGDSDKTIQFYHVAALDAAWDEIEAEMKATFGAS